MGKGYKNTTDSTKYYIAYNNNLTIIYFDDVPLNQEVNTGLDNFELYNTLDELKTRVNTLTQDNNYFDNNKNII